MLDDPLISETCALEEIALHHIEFVSFDELGAEISWIKGVSPPQTGETQSS